MKILWLLLPIVVLWLEVYLAYRLGIVTEYYDISPPKWWYMPYVITCLFVWIGSAFGSCALAGII